MNRRIRTAFCLFAVVVLGTGCGSNTAQTTPGQPVVAGGNSRIKFKPEYKKLLGEGGKTHFKPSEFKKPPQGVR